jgi:hypothetical protein
MISRKESFYKGQEVEFQDYRRCWVRGTVQLVEPSSHKITGPGGTLTTVDPGTVHVLVPDSVKRTLKVILLNPKRVRAVK